MAYKSYSNYTQFESHSSAINNKRIIEWFALISQLGLQASNSLQFDSIQAYYNAVEQIYFEVESVVNKPKPYEQIMRAYRKAIDYLEERPNLRTKKALRYLLNLAKTFNRSVIKELQTGQYFFRVGERATKGLQNVVSLSERFEAVQKRYDNERVEMEQTQEESSNGQNELSSEE